MAIRSSPWLLFAAVLASTIVTPTAERGRIAVDCAGPEKGSVRITAQQLTRKPPSYAFLVTNLTQSPISSIVIGRRDTAFAIVGVPSNIPSRMDAPPGWIARAVHVEETWYTYFLWEATVEQRRIQPQQSVAGFRITLPSLGTKRLGDLEGKEIEQVTFAGIPFEAALADGSCRWGVVGLDKLPE